MRKFSLLIVLLVVFFLTTSVFGANKVTEKTYEWNIGYCGSEGAVRDIAAEKFKEVIEEKTNGRITINLFPNEVLGTAQEMVEAVQMGALDFKVAGAGSLTNIMPELVATHTAFLLNDYEEGHAMLGSQVGDKIKTLCEEHGFKALSFFDLGFVQITNNKRPINNAADMSGLIIRAPNQRMSIATFEQLDCAVSTMPFSEVYLGLSQGVIDGQFNPVSSIVEMKFHEVQKYLAMVNLFYYHGILVMNLDLWNNLETELRDIVQEAAIQAQELSYEFMENTDAQYLERIKEEDAMEITYPDLDSFREKIKPVYSIYEEQAGQEMMNIIYDFLDDYRSPK